MTDILPLKPFGTPAPVTLTGDFSLRSNAISVRFDLDDPQQIVRNTLATGEWNEAPRVDGLWKTTCFEAFWSEPGSAAYWELNLSPSGAWQLYRFTAERTPQPPQASNDFALISLHTTPATVTAELTTSLRLAAVDVSLTAVIETAERQFFYAVTHAGPRPDFHRRDSFTIRRTLE